MSVCSDGMCGSRHHRGQPCPVCLLERRVKALEEKDGRRGCPNCAVGVCSEHQPESQPEPEESICGCEGPDCYCGAKYHLEPEGTGQDFCHDGYGKCECSRCTKRQAALAALFEAIDEMEKDQAKTQCFELWDFDLCGAVIARKKELVELDG